MKNILVFDVESTSLYGTGFAVGAVVADKDGTILEKFELLSLEGKAKASDWVKENVIPSLDDMPTCATDLELRDSFYEFYMAHKESCDIWSDCNFPVETNFLNEVVKDDFEKREWEMPYPLKDISTIVDINIDRVATYPTELRKHNPTDDSIASLHHLLLLS